MTVKAARDALRRRFEFLNTRIAVEQRTDVLDREQAERSAIQMGADWLDVRLMPDEGDKLVIRPRHGGVEVLLVTDVEPGSPRSGIVAHVMIERDGDKLLITTDGDVSLDSEPVEEPVR